MSIDRIEALLQEQRGLPPVAQWDPPLSGDIDIRIDRDGVWHHEGDRITREPLVALFASILRREADGEYYLVTPVEKWRIVVEDAPLLAVAVQREGEGTAQRLLFTLNTGRHVPLDQEAMFDMRGSTELPRPYLRLAHGLSARLARPVYYEIVAMAEEVDGQICIRSHGFCFPLTPAG